MPQHNETERELLALLQKEQERNSSTASTSTEPALPEINPLMFLSASAQREFEAAQTFAVSVPQITPPEVAVAQVPVGRNIASDDFSFNDPDWDIQAELSTSPGIEATPDLDAIFMGQATREIGDTRAARLCAERLGIEFTRATDFTVDASGDFPRVYNPPRATGGQVVSQRGPNGFTAVLHQAPITPRQATDPRPTAPQGPIKSRFERLLGKSIID